MKVVQQRCWISMLVQGPLTGDQLVVLTGELLCPIYGIETTSAECMAAAFRRATCLPIVQTLAVQFRFFIRASTLDKAGGCQRFIRNHCIVFPTSTPMPSCCFIHCGHTAAKKAAALQDSDVSGMFSFVSETEEPLQLTQLRNLLGDGIRSTTTVHTGATLPDTHPDIMWKRDMLDALLPSDCMANRHRKWVLLAMINGTVGDCFSHYGVLRDDAVPQVARALIPRKFNIFQRQRWLKHVKCISEIALLFV